MEILSINSGKAEAIDAKSGQTGIFKRPVPEAQIGPYGLRGDTIVDTAHHGGVDQAVYAYSRADYDWWAATLGRDMPDGLFGENLTLDRWPADVICVGDRLVIGDVTLEVTSPRIPCVTLDARMGLKGFSKVFLGARRPGPYFRVIRSGRIKPGPAQVLPFQGTRKRLIDWPGLFGPRLRSRSEAQEWLDTPVHFAMRQQLEDLLNDRG